MKKVLLFCAAAAALLLSASCNKGADNKEVVLPAAKYKAEAKKLNLLDSNQNPGYKSVEFTESGRYIICKQALLGGAAAVKAETPVTYLHGTYTVNNNVYTLSNFGTITVIDGQITINLSDGDNIVLNYTEAEKYPENDFYTTIARAWKVDKTDISVNFDGKSAVGVVKNGCDIPAILKELEEKANVDLKDEDFAGYVVSEINFTMSKTIEIAFTGKAPVAGALALSENGSLSYELTGSNGVEVLSGKANGKFDLNPGLGANQIMLTLDTELTTKSGKTYTGKVSFILSPKAS
jgi:hypothetical protein